MAFFSIQTFSNAAASAQLVRRPPRAYGEMRRWFMEMESAGLEERKALTAQRLDQVLSAAKDVPFYRDLELGTDLSAWPYLTREEVSRAHHRFTASAGFLSATAETRGTAGAPLKLRRSWQGLLAEQVSLDLLTERAGVDLTRAKVAELNNDLARGTSSLGSMLHGRCHMAISAEELCAGEIDACLRRLRQFAPQVIVTAPSMLEIFCNLIHAVGMPLPSLRLIISTSEALRSELREKAAATFLVPVIDRYCQAERVNLATSTRDGQFFFSPAYGMNELLYQSQDENYDYYEIVGTSLWNSAQFLIRYRTGDIAILPRGTGGAECEEITFGLRPFIGITGRVPEYLKALSRTGAPRGERRRAMRNAS